MNKFLCAVFALAAFAVFHLVPTHPIQPNHGKDVKQTQILRSHSLAFEAAKILDEATDLFAAHAEAIVINNSSSYLDYHDQPVTVDTWKLLPVQPTKTFHRMTVFDNSGYAIEYGIGTGAIPQSANVQRFLLHQGNAPADARVVEYPVGLSYQGSTVDIWIRRVGGTSGASSQIQSGQNVTNFIY